MFSSVGKRTPIAVRFSTVGEWEGLGVQRYKLGGMKLAGLEGAKDKCISGED